MSRRPGCLVEKDLYVVSHLMTRKVELERATQRPTGAFASCHTTPQSPYHTVKNSRYSNLSSVHPLLMSVPVLKHVVDGAAGTSRVPAAPDT